MLDPTKRWKLSYEDFRNRKKWDVYETAADEMFRETSKSPMRPGTSIPANSKKYARVEALKVIAKRLSSGVDIAPAELDPEVIQEAQELFEIDPACASASAAASMDDATGVRFRRSAASAPLAVLPPPAG